MADYTFNPTSTSNNVPKSPENKQGARIWNVFSSNIILDTSNYYTDESYAYYTNTFGFYMNKSIGVGFDEFKN
jgi:hypothetical protein